MSRWSKRYSPLRFRIPIPRRRVAALRQVHKRVGFRSARADAPMPRASRRLSNLYAVLRLALACAATLRVSSWCATQVRVPAKVVHSPTFRSLFPRSPVALSVASPVFWPPSSPIHLSVIVWPRDRLAAIIAAPCSTQLTAWFASFLLPPFMACR